MVSAGSRHADVILIHKSAWGWGNNHVEVFHTSIISFKRHVHNSLTGTLTARGFGNVVLLYGKSTVLLGISWSLCQKRNCHKGPRTPPPFSRLAEGRFGPLRNKGLSICQATVSIWPAPLPSPRPGFVCLKFQHQLRPCVSALKRKSNYFGGWPDDFHIPTERKWPRNATSAASCHSSAQGHRLPQLKGFLERKDVKALT